MPAAREYCYQQGEDITALLQVLNAAPATLLGWSAGGIHALHVAVKHPELVKRLILYEPDLYIRKYIDLTGALTFIKLNILKVLGHGNAALRPRHDVIDMEFEPGVHMGRFSAVTTSESVSSHDQKAKSQGRVARASRCRHLAVRRWSVIVLRGQSQECPNRVDPSAVPFDVRMARVL